MALGTRVWNHFVEQILVHKNLRGGYQAYLFGNINFEIEVAQQGPYMYQHFGEVSGPRSAPNRLRATPCPNMGAWNSHMAILILGGHMGHQIVPLITLSHPI